MYQAVLPFNLIEGFNRVEAIYDGNIVALIIMFICESHYNLLGFIIEDFIFADLNIFNFQIFTNFYFPYSFATFAIIFLQFHLFDEQIRLRIPSNWEDLYFSTNHLSHYQTLNNRKLEHFPIYFYVNLIFFYYFYLAQLRLYARFNSSSNQAFDKTTPIKNKEIQKNQEGK